MKKYYTVSALAKIFECKPRYFNRLLAFQGFQTREINDSLMYYWKPTTKGKKFAAVLRMKPNLPFTSLVWDIDIIDELDHACLTQHFSEQVRNYYSETIRDFLGTMDWVSKKVSSRCPRHVSKSLSSATDTLKALA